MSATGTAKRDPIRPVFHNVQALRFAAAFAVVLSHAADLLIPADAAHRWFWQVPWTAGVDLFFVVSGFIMFRLSGDRFGRTGAATDFLRRRAIRIVPPYWAVTTLTLAVVVAAGGRLKGTTVDAMRLVTSYGFLPWPRADGKMVPIVSQGWTLNYEALFYVCFAVALPYRRGVGGLIAAFALLTLVHPLLPRGTAAAFWSDPIILEFLGGMAIARLHVAGYRLPRPAVPAIAISGVLWFIATGGLRLGWYAHVLHVGIAALLLAASAILAPEPAQRGLTRRLIERGGDASYALYLSHYLVINAIALAWRRLGAVSPWPGVALGVACSIAVALICHLAVERPAIGWLQRRFAPTAPQHAPGRPLAASDPL